MSRRSRPKPIAAAVRDVRRRTEPATLLAAVQSAWAEAVGERVAAQATPIAERDATITVACRASTWAQELDLLQGELLEGLNRALSPRLVVGLRFVVGEESEKSHIST
jgi:predicted nucleic acid-binding Zn ribbon protein